MIVPQSSPAQTFWKRAHDTIAGLIRQAVVWVFDPAPSPSGPRYFRPHLWELEPRLAPAVLVWHPIMGNSAVDIRNWSDEAGNQLKGGQDKFVYLQDTFVFDNRSNNAQGDWDITMIVKQVKIESGYFYCNG